MSPTPHKAFALACLTALVLFGANASRAASDWRSLLPPAAKHRLLNSELTHIQARDVRLGLNSQITLKATRLDADLSSDASNKLASLDDLSSLLVQVNYAQLEVDQSVLTHLVNKALEAAHAPLKIEALSAQEGQLGIKGHIARHGLWLPFSISGKPSIKNAHQISLVPTSMSINGVQVMPALKAAKVYFDEILKFKSSAFLLDKQTMVLNLPALLPPPSMKFSLEKLDFQKGKAFITLGKADSQQPVIDCKLQQCPHSFVALAGGQFKAFGLTLHGSPSILTRQGTEALDLPLDQAQNLITQSTIRMRKDGAVWLQTPEIVKPEHSLSADTQHARKVFDRLIDIVMQPASGSSTPLTFAVKNSQIVVPPNVPVTVRSLIAQTQGQELATLPFQTQNVLSGNITLGFPALETLMNKVTFAYAGSPIRQVQLDRKQDTETQAGRIKIQMEAKPHFGPLPLIWTPIQMTGRFQITEEGRALQFVPEKVKTFGLNVLPLLNKLGLSLADLVRINRPDVQLIDNHLNLVFNQAIPPLQMNTRIQRLKVTKGETGEPELNLLVGTLNSTQIELANQRLHDLPDGMWVKSGKLNAFGMEADNTEAWIKPFSATQPLSVNLQDYPAILTRGELHMPEPGWIEVDLNQ